MDEGVVGGSMGNGVDQTNGAGAIGNTATSGFSPTLNGPGNANMAVGESTALDGNNNAVASNGLAFSTQGWDGNVQTGNGTQVTGNRNALGGSNGSPAFSTNDWDGDGITGSGTQANRSFGDVSDSALALDSGKAQNVSNDSTAAQAMDSGQAQYVDHGAAAMNSGVAQTGVTNNNGAVTPSPASPTTMARVTPRPAWPTPRALARPMARSCLTVAPACRLAMAARSD
jgi:hypothetical protein